MLHLDQWVAWTFLFVQVAHVKFKLLSKMHQDSQSYRYSSPASTTFCKQHELHGKGQSKTQQFAVQHN